ncbi:MAG: cytochrome c oxidase accessory protein CcoG, partial [Brevundimonas sp.]
LRAPGRPETDPLRLAVEPNRVTSIRVFVTAPADPAAAGSRDAAFELRSGDKTRTVRTAFDYGTPQP